MYMIIASPSSTASRIWENIPSNIKTLPLFIKQYKRYLHDSQT